MKKFEMLNIITKDCELTAKEKLVAQYFVYKSNKSGACYPCVATIAEECSVSRRTVQRATKKLAEKEYIIKEERFKFGKQTSNLYSFNILLLLEMEIDKEKKSSTSVQEMQMEVIEFEDLLEVPEEFIQEDEEEIDLDELAALSMADDENDYIAWMWEDHTIQNEEISEEPEGIEHLTNENKKQGIQGIISFSVMTYVMVFLIERMSTAPDFYSVSITFTLLKIEQQRIKASRKIMGAFFPP